MNTIINLLINIKSLILNIVCKIRYLILLRNLRNEARKRKINVVFLVNEISKWKAQRLYEYLCDDTHFNPIIGLTCADVDWNLSLEERKSKRNNLIDFFMSRNMHFVELCDVNNMKSVPLYSINADIVFYQQPWNIHEDQRPHKVSKHQLTCYFPYYVPNYSLLTTDCQKGFHYLLWRYYHLSDEWVKSLDEAIPQYLRAVKVVASGHPMLDVINKSSNTKCTKEKRVIYAPHWSVYSDVFDNAEKYSTFQHNGKEILDFAKKHPEIHWSFKPHPTLKTSLLRTKLWTENEIEKYYKEWSEIGEICSGEYVDLFWESSALITDCGSFLVEYPCTKNPIIRLVSSACCIPVPKPSRELFDSFYNVHDLDEMYEVFNTVLIEGKDPKRGERLSAVSRAGLLTNNASLNIMNDLRRNLGLN